MQRPVYPSLVGELAATPLKGGQFSVGLKDEARRIVLDTIMLWVLERFDGQLTSEEICAQLRRGMLPLPPEGDFVLGFAQSLEPLGWIELRTTLAPQPALSPRHQAELRDVKLRHRCLGCGRSCHHQVNLRDQTFIRRAPEMFAELAKIYPDLAELPGAIVASDDGGEPRLPSREDGSCMYLSPERLCRIHKHFGESAKPLTCRLFPIQVAETEEGLRVGVTRCYEAHKTRGNEPERTLSAISGIPLDAFYPPDIRGLNPRHLFMTDPDQELPPTSVQWRNLQLEQRVLTLLAAPDADLRRLMDLAYQGLSKTETSPLQNRLGLDVSKTMSSDLQRLGEHLWDDAMQQSVRRATPEGFTDELGGLLEYLTALKPRSFEGLTELERVYGMQVVEDWFVLRNWLVHPDFASSLLNIAQGVLVASWRAADAGAKDEGEVVSDIFAHTLTTWVRFLLILRCLRRGLGSFNFTAHLSRALWLEVVHQVCVK